MEVKYRPNVGQTPVVDGSPPFPAPPTGAALLAPGSGWVVLEPPHGNGGDGGPGAGLTPVVTATGSVALTDPASGRVALVDPATGGVAVVDAASGHLAVVDPVAGTVSVVDLAARTLVVFE
jgi:hypothetical protein